MSQARTKARTHDTEKQPVLQLMQRDGIGGARCARTLPDARLWQASFTVPSFQPKIGGFCDDEGAETMK